MKGTVGALMIAISTCSPVLNPPPDGPVVVDAGQVLGDHDVCQAACDHLVAAACVPAGSPCVETCMATMGTVTGRVMDWNCAAHKTAHSDLLHCGVGVCE